MNEKLTIKDLRASILQDFQFRGISWDDFIKEYKKEHEIVEPVNWLNCDVCKKDIKERYAVKVSYFVAKGGVSLTPEVSISITRPGSDKQLEIGRTYSFHESCLDKVVSGEANHEEIIDLMNLQAGLEGHEISDIYDDFKKDHLAASFGMRDICYLCLDPINSGGIRIRRLKEDGKNDMRIFNTQASRGAIYTLPEGSLSVEFYNLHEECFDKLI